MKLRKVFTVLTCLGTFQMGLIDVQAAVPLKSVAKKASRPANQIKDVALQAGGRLTGHVVDGQGRPMKGATVTVRQRDRVLATTTTDSKGRFQVMNLRGGSYEIAAGQGSGLYRVWTEQAAPPNARNSVAIVSKASVIRGQLFSGTNALVTTGVLVLAGGGIAWAISESNDDDDDEDTPTSGD